MLNPAALDPAALDAARRLVAIARARYPVVEAWLYGSHARGEARADSDVDVALVMEGQAAQVRRAGRALAGDTADVLLYTGIVVSPLTIPAAAWAAPSGYANPFLLHDIRRDGVALCPRLRTGRRLPGSRERSERCRLRGSLSRWTRVQPAIALITRCSMLRAPR